MKRREIKFIVGMLVVTVILLGVEIKYARLNTQYKNQLEQYNNKLDERSKLLETTDKTIKSQTDRLNQLQREIDEKLKQLEKIKSTISVRTDISLDLKNYIFEVAKDNGYRPEMLLGIIQTESKWQPNKVSATHDYGLCQINQSNIKVYKLDITKKYGSFDVFNPKMNIDMMIMTLNEAKRIYQNKYKSNPNETELLLAYNSGSIKSNFGGNAYTKTVLSNTEQYGKWITYVNEVSNLRKTIE